MVAILTSPNQRAAEPSTPEGFTLATSLRDSLRPGVTYRFPGDNRDVSTEGAPLPTPGD